MMTVQPLDLRRLPVWERAATVLERADSLATGGTFEFLTEIDPRALMSRLEQLRPDQLAFEHRHLGDSGWHVTLRRVHLEAGASSLAVALRAEPRVLEAQ